MSFKSHRNKERAGDKQAACIHYGTCKNAGQLLRERRRRPLIFAFQIPERFFDQISDPCILPPNRPLSSGVFRRKFVDSLAGAKRVPHDEVGFTNRIFDVRPSRGACEARTSLLTIIKNVITVFNGRA